MAKRLWSVSSLLACLLALSAVPAFAGGYTVVPDITAQEPTPIPNTVYGNLVPTRWDSRCIPVIFRMNSSQDPIPNPLGEPILTVLQAKKAIKRAFTAWNQIPTSYINLQFGANIANPGLRRFDFINEVTFRTGAAFGGVASTVATRLISDSNLTDGADVDGDGDSDVSNDISQCADVDHDGDREFPEGLYKAGTILDMDIIFNTKPTNGIRFTDTTNLATLTSLLDFRSFDLQAEASRQAGLAMGLTASFLPEVNPLNNPDEPTMYGFLNFADPIEMIRRRTLKQEDKGTASFLYPEGSDTTGPAALQGNDVAFDDVYGVISGSVEHGRLHKPVLAGNVTAVAAGTGDELGAAYVGNARVAVNPTTGQVLNLPPDLGIVDGNYQIPVPFGPYHLKLEAIDGFPQNAGGVNTIAVLGELYGLNNFQEERWSGNTERAREQKPGQSKVVQVSAGHPLADGIDFVTNRTVTVTNSGPPNRGPWPDPPGTCFAVRFPISQLAAANPRRNLVLSTALVEGVCPDESLPNIMANVWLAFGHVNGTSATIDLAHPLESIGPFPIQQFDREPWYFTKSNLSQTIFREFNRGLQTDVFLVVKTPDNIPAGSFSGLSTRPAVDLRADGFVPAGLSYLATDCSNFQEDPERLYEMDLIFSE